MIATIRVPICNGCGEPWLPQKGKTRNNPEEAERCGKCKTPAWNKGPEGKARRTLRAMGYSSGLPEEAPRSLCRHRLLNCPECHK